ncbi:MAG: hypothetical protein RMM58_05705 [Chloroflexota bacterium]|nr:hypothetical protein [Dehalococcoidia bacterium]MDW8253356.1 hypothetical protein [Chloroflexota bacterium]
MTPRSFRDLAIGDELGPARDQVDQARVRRFLSVRGSGRHDGRFTSLEEAKALGLPRLLVPGPLLAGLLDRTLRQWLPTARLTKLDLVFRRNVWQDSPFEMQAIVVDILEDEGEPAVTLDLTVVDESGDHCVTGTATLVFPREA